jgi:IS5 family transposase
MYKKDNHQFAFGDFNQPLGMKMDPNNRWVLKAATIPWDSIEDKYAALFPSNTGTVAKPLRMALGSLIIQKQLGFSDRELVEEITENPYLQFFIGLPGYNYIPPFVPPLLVEFRKRLTPEILGDINEMIIDYNKPKEPKDPPKSGLPGDGWKVIKPDDNNGTLIVDATCAPQNIRFPQDVNLLNEAREDLEKMASELVKGTGIPMPRMYPQKARKQYLHFVRSRKHSLKSIRRAIRAQLQFIRRDLAIIEGLMAIGLKLTGRQAKLLETVRKVYEQQKYMYDNGIHTVPDRIVSISQPYIRPIVRGKAAAPVEFGAKLDLSIADGLGRIEKISFDAYNESEFLPDVIERYRKREGHYPERVLADKIYRNRKNLQYCKSKGIRLSGPGLGRHRKDAAIDRKIEYTDNADRVEVERSFSLSKRCYGLGKISTKLEETTGCSIVLSILAMNIDRLANVSLCKLLAILFSRFQDEFRINFHSGSGCLYLKGDRLIFVAT